MGAGNSISSIPLSAFDISSILPVFTELASLGWVPKVPR